MYKFGQPPRSLESFGVVGLLGDDCKIYYDNIFSSLPIGRVTDLLAAQLQRLGCLPDQARFRTILTLSLCEAYRCQLLALGGESEALPEPLVVECGVDSEKITVGVAFSYSETEEFEPKSLVQKLSSPQAAVQAWGPVEGFIARMASDSDQVVVRVEESSRRIEVVSIIGLTPSATRGEIELVILRPEVKASQLKAEYVELGDLDYEKLLQEHGPKRNREVPATGEILLKGAEAEDELIFRISGSKAEEEKSVRISGVTQHLKNDDTKITVSGQETSNEAVATFTSPEKKLEGSSKQIDMYRDQIARLQARIAEFEQHERNGAVVVGFGVGPEEKQNGSSLKEIIQSIWPFSGGKQAAKASSRPVDATAGASAPATPIAVDSDTSDTDAIDPATGKLLKEQVERLQSTIEKIQQESANLKKEVGNDRAKKWADGMVGELLAEKARFNELSRKLNTTFRQKQLSFKNMEVMLQEELRKKEEQLKQKSFALERAKEQLSQATTANERGRANRTTASEETQHKQKLQFTQKLLAGAKEETATLARRLEEARQQLAVAQSASKAKLHKELDYDAMRSKYDRLVRQSDEVKRSNQQLLEKVSELEKQKPVGNPEELKKRLETAMRVVATHQKDAERLRTKLEETQKNETRLKAELARATNALRALKNSSSNSGNPGSDGSGGSGSQAA